MEATKIEEKAETVFIERLLNAPVERVFAAWGKSEALKQWFSPEDVVVQDVQLDFSVGGVYRLEFLMPEGHVVVHSGKYLEIEAPNLLVFSWILDGQLCGGSEKLYADTQVTVELEARGLQTCLRLRHEGLPTEASCAAHTFGWNGCLVSLVAFMK